ncbi:hypothetical protein JCM3770_005857 [Rhodotorula araucariae]
MASRSDTVDILPPQPALHSEPSGFIRSDDEARKDESESFDYDKSESSSISTRAPLAPRSEEAYTPGAAILNFLGIKKRKAIYELDAVATQESVFDGPLSEHYQPSAEWENKDAFDPSLRWTNREERDVRRKIDLKIFLWVLVMFFALDIDRGNMTNATADNLLKDLKISQADYNLGNTLSKLGFLSAELPSQMIGKKIGVDIWLPMQICIFSVLSAAQFWMNGRASFLAFRFLIAFFQGGFIPDVILYLSYYYSKNELPVRLAFFWSINYIADMATAFLAVGLLKMRGIGGYAGWKWMFLLEGLFTLVIGVVSFFMLAPGPSQTKARWRPNGFFTDREVKVIVNKVVRDDPTKASMHNRQALTLKLLWKALRDFDMWPMYLIGLTFGIPGYPIKNYFQLAMKDLGFSTVMANLLSVPNTVFSVVNLVLLTCLSEIINNRAFVCSLENWWFIAPYAALVGLDKIDPWEYFALATVLLSFPYAHATQVSWLSRNSGSVRTRTVSASVYNMAVQVSSIIGANLYQANDKPRYYKANKAILAIVAFNLVVVYPGTFFYYRSRNAWKAEQWNAMTTEEKAHYLTTTTDEGCKRLDFVFAT